MVRIASATSAADPHAHLDLLVGQAPLVEQHDGPLLEPRDRVRVELARLRSPAPRAAACRDSGSRSGRTPPSAARGSGTRSPCSCSRCSIFPSPMPCSPVHVPPRSSAHATSSRLSRRDPRALVRVVRVEHDEDVVVAVAGVGDDRGVERERVGPGARVRRPRPAARSRARRRPSRGGACPATRGAARRGRGAAPPTAATAPRPPAPRRRRRTPPTPPPPRRRPRRRRRRPRSRRARRTASARPRSVVPLYALTAAIVAASSSSRRWTPTPAATSVAAQPAGVLERREREPDGDLVLGDAPQAHRQLGDHAERPLAADEERPQVVAGGALDRPRPRPDDAAVGEHDLEREHVRAHRAVADGRRPRRVRRRHPAERRVRARVDGEPEPVRRRRRG